MTSTPPPVAEPTLVVTFPMEAAARAAVAGTLGDAGRAVFLADLEGEARAEALRNAGALLCRNTAKELSEDELPLIAGARLLQFFTAGVDFIPLSKLPPGLPVAANRGAFAEPMAEHALAMALAAAKRLLVEHQAVARGEFNQFVQNRMLAGGVCGILGFGGVGAALARLARGIGMKAHALNRSGATDEAVDWIGGLDRLDDLLAASDVLAICAPLTPATEGLIDARALRRMKPDAILVNLARGELVVEAELYAHLKANPRFTACLDAWWVEPVRHGQFRMDHPFTDLPNVIASPHNSAQAGRSAALRRAVENCRRALLGEPPLHLVGADEYMA
jgi:phosphoglycerate dehydrogenase-like enzyme